MTDTTITIGGFQIHEPTTVLTDILIAILAISFYKRLSKFHDETIRNWSYFFLLLGTATLIGSSSHAFFAIHEGWKYKSLWLGMQVINGIGIYFAQRATLISVLKDAPSKKRWEWSYYIQFILFLGFLFCVQKYFVSIIENALALIPIMILHYQHKRPFARTIANGIAVSFLTAFVHLLKLSLHAYFNYNDIAHVFIMISLWIMYKGVRLKANPPDQIQP